MWRVLKETDSDTWKQGLNSVTIATSINLISMAVTIHLAAEWLYQRMDVFLSRKESTICRLLVSAVGYIGAIAVILYTLSMFGVRTATLVGGAGAVTISFSCLEKDRFAMSLVIRRELVDTVNDLLYGTPAIREH